MHESPIIGKRLSHFILSQSPSKWQSKSHQTQIASAIRNILTLLLADSDAVLPPDQDTGVQDENIQRSPTRSTSDFIITYYAIQSVISNYSIIIAR